MTEINYDHDKNLHSRAAPRAITRKLIELYEPESVLDVGCGNGSWLNAFSEEGVVDYWGIDGVDISSRKYLANPLKFSQVDFRKIWSLERTFDLALCLEVAEHLPAEFSKLIVNCLTKHADVIIFSAACPGQSFGQGHVNCQPPEYWQFLFNSFGFVCADILRPVIWAQDFEEYWYKQNIFVAIKNPPKAGTEIRIPYVVHPSLLSLWQDKADEMESILLGRKTPRQTCLLATIMIRRAFRNRFGV
jgi:SAM-dependent methyltransferase